MQLHILLLFVAIPAVVNGDDNDVSDAVKKMAYHAKDHAEKIGDKLKENAKAVVGNGLAQDITNMGKTMQDDSKVVKKAAEKKIDEAKKQLEKKMDMEISTNGVLDKLNLPKNRNEAMKSWEGVKNTASSFTGYLPSFGRHRSNPTTAQGTQPKTR